MSEKANDEQEEVLELGPIFDGEPPPKEGPARRVEKTRATLAYLLFALLAVIIIVTLAMLSFGILSPQSFDSVTGVLVAPVVGLLGAATGYYYGRGER